MGQVFHIIYVGPLFPGQNCFQRMEALKELGHRITAIDSLTPEMAKKATGIVERIRRRVFGLRDMCGVNRGILDAVNRIEADILWIDKGLIVEEATLREARRLRPAMRILGYSPDDMFALHNRTRQFLAHLPLYDLYVTTKSFGVEELKRLGARRVIFLHNAFDPHTHRPVNVSDEDRARLGGPVGFIGDYELERARSLHHLAENGLSVRVWGPNWDKCPLAHANLRLENKWIIGDDYARALCAFDINLGFLRKMHRDRSTVRSVEIPACGAFMLAERTDEHLELFEEGKEAEFFADDGELLRKTQYYLGHPEERLAIARAGRLRCERGGYDNLSRLRGVIDQLMAIPLDER
jgi:hypothetical protein